MKKRIFSFAICLCMVLACIVGFVGCGSKLSYMDAMKKLDRADNVGYLQEALTDESLANKLDIATSPLDYLMAGLSWFGLKMAC